MNIDLLIKMANEITSFWEGEVGEEKAPNEVATHLKRYWEPRMRAQMIGYFEERQGAGLNDIAKAAVALLVSQAKAAAPVATGVAATGGASGAPAVPSGKP
jgi:formate dehydrogenase subunit delta